jgi:hypothetical protein
MEKEPSENELSEDLQGEEDVEMPTPKKKIKFLDLLIAAIVLILLVVSVLIHIYIFPNSNEYKILITAIFTFLVFITSSYYSIRTMEKQSMVNARSQEMLSLEKEWCRHYEKDTDCYMCAFFSSILMLFTLICSIFYTYFSPKWLFMVHSFFGLAVITLFILIGIRVDWIKFKTNIVFNRILLTFNINCESILNDFFKDLSTSKEQEGSSDGEER